MKTKKPRLTSQMKQSMKYIAAEARRDAKKNLGRPRCGAVQHGSGRGCYLKPGHDGPHCVQGGGKWQASETNSRTDAVGQCKSTTLTSEGRVFCFLKSGHKGMHVCGKWEWYRGDENKHPITKPAATAAAPQPCDTIIPPQCDARFISDKDNCRCDRPKGHGGEHSLKDANFGWNDDPGAGITLTVGKNLYAFNDADARSLQQQLNALFGTPLPIQIPGCNRWPAAPTVSSYGTDTGHPLSPLHLTTWCFTTAGNTSGK
jgi:hypothetical protein